MQSYRCPHYNSKYNGLPPWRIHERTDMMQAGMTFAKEQMDAERRERREDCQLMIAMMHEVWEERKSTKELLADIRAERELRQQHETASSSGLKREAPPQQERKQERESSS